MMRLDGPSVRRARDPEDGGDDGMSLVELIVAMGIFLVLAVMIGGMLISVTKATTSARNISTDTRSAANGMNEMTRMIRAATENPLLSPAVGAYPNDPAVQVADVRTVTLYAYVNLTSAAETPVMVKFWINTANQLVETKWPGTTLVNGHWTFAATSLGDRIICDNVVSGSAIFGYLADDGSTITIPTGGIVSSTTLLSIRSVSVAFSVKSPKSRSSAITLQNTVGMPNLGFSNSSDATS